MPVFAQLGEWGRAAGHPPWDRSARTNQSQRHRTPRRSIRRCKLKPSTRVPLQLIPWCACYPAGTTRSAQSGRGRVTWRRSTATMAEHHDFRVLGRLAAAEQHKPAEDPDDDQVEQTKGHRPRSCRTRLISPIRRSQHLLGVMKRYRSQQRRRGRRAGSSVGPCGTDH